MKILLVSESYWPNADGGAIFERELVQGLIKKGHKVAVIAPGKKFANYTQMDGDYKIYRARAIKLMFNTKYKVSFWPFRYVKSIFKKFQPDVVHVHNPALLGLSAIKYCKKYNVPSVATNHLMPENILLNVWALRLIYKTSYKLIWRYLIWFHNKFDFITSPTQTALNLIKKQGLKKDSEAISNGVDLNIFRFRKANEKLRKKYHIKNKPTLLYLGRVDGEKRIDVIIKAASKVLKLYDFNLVIAGYGVEMKHLRNLADSLDIENNVIFTGFVPEKDKSSLYNLANVFVISSPAELQSIVTLEAMASDLPVIAADFVALKELVKDNFNGYLYFDSDEDELAKRIVKLLFDKQKIRLFGQKSREIVEKYHNLTSTIDKYEKIYGRVVK